MVLVAFRVGILKTRSIVLVLALVMCAAAISSAQTLPMIGHWKVEVTFPNGESRALQFEAQEGGKGSLQLLDPRAPACASGNVLGANWTRGEGQSVTFSGAVEFPLGNVGRDPGTLVFHGKVETGSLITGEVDFSPATKERPSKHGTFRAVRTGNP